MEDHLESNNNNMLVKGFKEAINRVDQQLGLHPQARQTLGTILKSKDMVCNGAYMFPEIKKLPMKRS